MKNISVNFDLDSNNVSASSEASASSSLSLGRAALVTLVIVGTASATDCAVRGTLGYAGQSVVGMFEKKDSSKTQQPPKNDNTGKTSEAPKQ